MLFDLSARTKLRLSGADRVRYLNGQITNDVRKANAHLAMAACVLSAKGKMDALVYLSADGEALLLDTDEDLRTTLPLRLERYVIADDVTIEDVTEQFALFHRIGEEPLALPNEPAEWRRGKRFGEAGWDLLVPKAEQARVRQELAKVDTLIDAEGAERFRIERGIPRWGRELTHEIIPIEANLEGNSVDYAKGCYIGQEVISRMKMSGRTSKRLCGLLSLDNTPLNPMAKIIAPDTGKEVGWMTSATRSGEQEIALGYVKRGYNDPGSKLQAPGPIEVVELPFR